MSSFPSRSRYDLLDLVDLDLVTTAGPGFTAHAQELDNCQKVLVYGKDLDADHPGFKDPHYRKRRQFFGDLANIYKYGQKIPRVKVIVK